jgi:hypothetical protein
MDGTSQKVEATIFFYKYIAALWATTNVLVDVEGFVGLDVIGRIHEHDFGGHGEGIERTEFRETFGTEEQCIEFLIQMCWGRGFACQRWGNGGYTWMKYRMQVQCNRYKQQINFTVGTVFHGTKLPLPTWSQVIYYLTQSKG